MEIETKILSSNTIKSMIIDCKKARDLRIITPEAARDIIIQLGRLLMSKAAAKLKLLDVRGIGPFSKS